jgi:cyclophilin family peptidyl-prolyl cis-trans isomerase
LALARAAASLIARSRPAIKGEQTPMAPIQNGLKASRKASRFGIPLYLALAFCLAPLATRAEEAGTEPAAVETESAAVNAEAVDAAVAAIDAFIAEQKVDKTNRSWKSTLAKPPKVSFTAGKSYFWNLETNKGKIKIKLMPEVAPMHVSSTIYLTRLGFYDDTIFHRVIPKFMAQGGDPTGTGRGGPGYKYDGEFDRTVKHNKPGMLSMANAGPGTDGSQFFLTFVETPHLDGKHTIFGRVVEGMDTVKELEKSGSRSGKTTEQLVIESATIRVE